MDNLADAKTWIWMLIAVAVPFASYLTTKVTVRLTLKHLRSDMDKIETTITGVGKSLDAMRKTQNRAIMVMQGMAYQLPENPKGTEKARTLGEILDLMNGG